MNLKLTNGGNTYTRGGLVQPCPSSAHGATPRQYAWRVHERISRLQRKGDCPVRASRILSQQEGSLVGYLRGISLGSVLLVACISSAQPPETMMAVTGPVMVGCMAAGNMVLKCIRSSDESSRSKRRHAEVGWHGRKVL